MINFKYNFPEYVFDGDMTDEQKFLSQRDKVFEETRELCAEVSELSLDKDFSWNLKALEEAMDTLHAVETFLRLFDHELVEYMHEYVIGKNIDRGYYFERTNKVDTTECDPDCVWINHDTNRCDKRAFEPAID